MKKLALIAAAAVAWSGAALADGPAWTYVDLSYLRGDSGDDSTDAFVIEASKEFADKYRIQLSYYDGEIDDPSSSDSLDFDGFIIRFGVSPALSDTIDLVADLGYFDLSQDEDNVDSNDGDGLITRVGLRAQILDNVDIWGYTEGYFGEVDCDGSLSSCTLFFNDVEDGDDFTQMSASIGGQYQWTERAGVTLNHTFNGLLGSDYTQFGIRYTF